MTTLSATAPDVPATALDETTKVLFVCGKNRLRSPTAEQVFADRPGIACASAGLGQEADVPVSIELLEWADLIFVMEKIHRAKLAARFAATLSGRRVVCLDIPDRFGFMAPELVRRLLAKVTPHLPPVAAAR